MKLEIICLKYPSNDIPFYLQLTVNHIPVWAVSKVLKYLTSCGERLGSVRDSQFKEFEQMSISPVLSIQPEAQVAVPVRRQCCQGYPSSSSGCLTVTHQDVVTAAIRHCQTSLCRCEQRWRQRVRQKGTLSTVCHQKGDAFSYFVLIQSSLNVLKLYFESTECCLTIYFRSVFLSFLNGSLFRQFMPKQNQKWCLHITIFNI